MDYSVYKRRKRIHKEMKNKSINKYIHVERSFIANMYMKLKDMKVCLVSLDGISTIVGYLIPNPLYITYMICKHIL